MPEILISSTQTEFINAAGAIIGRAGREAIQREGRFSLALSGGSTPLPLYQALAKREMEPGFDWVKTHFFWGDERPVGMDHPDSNFGHARQALLAPLGIDPSQIHRIQGELPPADAAESYQREVLAWFQDSPPRLDLILLGLGGDGHTASLFPGTSIVTQAGAPDEPWVDAVFVPRLDTWRISMTCRLISAARKILFLVKGQEKAEVLEQVLNGPRQPERYPAQLFRDKAAWLLDRAAAQKVGSN